jgi:hypothetical protein
MATVLIGAVAALSTIAQQELHRRGIGPMAKKDLTVSIKVERFDVTREKCIGGREHDWDIISMHYNPKEYHDYDHRWCKLCGSLTEFSRDPNSDDPKELKRCVDKDGGPPHIRVPAIVRLVKKKKE